MFRLVCCCAVVVCVTLGASRLGLAQGSAGSDDPLLEALKQLQQDVEQLRRELNNVPAPAPMRGTAAAPAAAPQRPPAAVPASAPASAVSLPPKADTQPAAASDHWSLQKIARPRVPAVSDAGWCRADLDRFILAGVEAAGLKPNPDADRHALVRRIALDLTGLPPSPQEIARFVEDPAGDDEVLARVVDYYLARPQFGERWGRHWLDVVRYADSVGNVWNAPFTYAWRYRDYVIDSLARDKPYDRFVLEQLAGDLLPARTADEQRENLIATGFLTLGAADLQDGRLEGFVMDRVDEQIDVTTRALLGLTISCARCHDHKYEPIAMRDYYALAGIFYSTRTLSGQGHSGELGSAGYVDPQQLIALPPQSAAAGRSATTTSTGRGVHSMSDFMNAWQTERDAVRFTTDPDLAMGVLDDQIRDCPLRNDGDAYDRGPAPPRGDLRIPGLAPLPKIPTDASGRLELARWIASDSHPLTARVMVNRVWQHLFGRGIVATVDDFGATGEAPTHPELLDHLADRFMADGWSLKRLIRGIVLSRTYRLASSGHDAREQIDPQNARYWRANLRRLEMEAVHDSLLLAGGRLSTERPAGIQVAGVGGKGRNGMTRSLLGIDSPYRSVYLPVLRSLLPPLYQCFDFPDPSQIKGQREVTTVAPQALWLLNGDLVVSCARDAAAQLLADEADDRQRVRAAYLRLVSRPPTSEETEAALTLIDDLRPDDFVRDATLYRWTVLVQALAAGAEFRYLK